MSNCTGIARFIPAATSAGVGTDRYSPWMADPLTDPRAADLLGAEPEQAGALAGVFRIAAGESGRTSTGLAAAQHDATWTGRAADAFRRAIGRLPGQLGRLGDGFTVVADALYGYEDVLEPIQSEFERVIAQLGEAEARLEPLRAAARADGAATDCETQIASLQRRAFALLDDFANARNACRAAIAVAQQRAPSAPMAGSGVTVIDFDEAIEWPAAGWPPRELAP